MCNNPSSVKTANENWDSSNSADIRDKLHPEHIYVTFWQHVTMQSHFELENLSLPLWFHEA